MIFGWVRVLNEFSNYDILKFIMGLLECNTSASLGASIFITTIT
jgi:hypothetical protein